jgi:hypothetical protein
MTPTEQLVAELHELTDCIDAHAAGQPTESTPTLAAIGQRLFELTEQLVELNRCARRSPVTLTP